MTTYLVAGSTGHLGRPTFEELQRRGLDVRGLSRTTGPDRVAADLTTGAGLAEALRGVDVVVHTATTDSGRDLAIARRLTEAAREAGVGHFVLISIVGIDRIPFGFYRQRLAIERIVEESGLPHTVQRATQFHSFVDRLLSAQRRLPVLIVPSVRLQPIAEEDLAVRLADLATAAPVGRAADVGGPEVRFAPELAERWRVATGTKRRIVPLRLPGRLFAALDASANLVPGEPYGTRTFEDYLTRAYRASAASSRS
ncbi:SDR family oxidoreductase [Naasia sp. SYSU D00057]|uniref:SDR family oxidoreductase n=1 Tax=Naasia sp. SYSU D00057 TaxID=2817380 RepID=UPI001B30863A|nr:NAD(P)H-binding protein [Naasia sp. SYSU D00057]